MPQHKKQNSSRRLMLGVSAICIVVIVIAAGLFGATGGKSSDPVGPTFNVKQGPLSITVTEAGTIQSHDQAVITSKVPDSRTIIYLIPEGTYVKKGELLVELDSSDLQDNQIDQQITVENAQAALVASQQSLAITQSQAQSDIATAKLAYELAQSNLKQYTDPVNGQYKQDLEKAQAAITVAQGTVAQDKNTLDGSEQLYKLNYISKSKLDSDKLNHKQAQLNLTQAVGAKNLLIHYTHPMQVKQLTSDIQQDKMALDRTQRQAKANMVQAQADLRAKQAELNRQQAKLEKLDTGIANCKMYAPRAGMVIYATTGSHHRRNQEPLQEGQLVREREELIDLPTPGSMTAEIKIHESNINKVEIDQPVRITVDAYPDRVYIGKVTYIAPLPDAQSWYSNPDLKVYDTRIKVLGNAVGLRTGMSCQATIIVDHYDNAMYVPVQSVIRVGHQPTVFVVDHGKVHAQPVTLGLDNNAMVRIIKGLTPGQPVLLAPPLSAGQANNTGQLAVAMKDVTASNAASAKNAAKSPSKSPSKTSDKTIAEMLKQAKEQGYQPPTEKMVEQGRKKHEQEKPPAAPDVQQPDNAAGSASADPHQTADIHGGRHRTHKKSDVSSNQASHATNLTSTSDKPESTTPAASSHAEGHS